MLFPAAVIDGLVHQLGGRQLQKECSSLKQHKFAYAYRNQQTCTAIYEHQPVKCPVGTAVITSAGGKELKLEFDNIVHTTPPFYNYPPLITQEVQQLLGINAVSLDEEAWAYELLLSCYRHSFDIAFGGNDIDSNQTIIGRLLDSIGLGRNKLPYPENQRVAVPLLGAGCRGFPISVAIEAAAQASTSWLSQSQSTTTNDIDCSLGQAQNETIHSDCVIAFGLLDISDAKELTAQIEKLLGTNRSD
jgi:O-acetyl-ADP-ribose deacetylase (regulator of RNase III)